MERLAVSAFLLSGSQGLIDPTGKKQCEKYEGGCLEVRFLSGGEVNIIVLEIQGESHKHGGQIGLADCRAISLIPRAFAMEPSAGFHIVPPYIGKRLSGIIRVVKWIVLV